MNQRRTKERPKNSELGNVLFVKIDYPPLHPTIRLALDSLPSRVSRFPLQGAARSTNYSEHSERSTGAADLNSLPPAEGAHPHEVTPPALRAHNLGVADHASKLSGVPDNARGVIGCS